MRRLDAWLLRWHAARTRRSNAKNAHITPVERPARGAVTTRRKTA